MEKLKMLLLTLGLFSIMGYSQEVALDAMPTATLTEGFYLTLDPSVPVSNYYKVDISHMGFATEEEAIKQCRAYLSGNLISNEVHFSENYLIVRIYTEYMGGDLDLVKLQTYLNQLSKPQ